MLSAQQHIVSTPWTLSRGPRALPRPGRWPRPTSRRPGLLALLAMMAGVLALVPPFGEFAVDDDWAYARAVHQLLVDGVYHPSIWIDTSFLAQAWWGAAVASVLGFSHTSLRLST